ncbi:hypothetical protein Aph02nite_77440 [Actinoplanes philippinensis]|nr:hypothetical protein Aph02nite_77440 [Actinoplanes philippinensis]
MKRWASKVSRSPSVRPGDSTPADGKAANNSSSREGERQSRDDMRGAAVKGAAAGLARAVADWLLGHWDI